MIAATDLFSLKDRVALVTGGSRGIGRMIAAGFIAQGARVYISSRKADACEKTAAELSKGGGSCLALPADASTVAGAQALAKAYAARETKLDILVNNAGAAWLEKFDQFPEKGWDKVVDLNLKAPFFLTQALHGVLMAAATRARPAKVINIASIDGWSVNPQETYSYLPESLSLDVDAARVPFVTVDEGGSADVLHQVISPTVRYLAPQRPRRRPDRTASRGSRTRPSSWRAPRRRRSRARSS